MILTDPHNFVVTNGPISPVKFDRSHWSVVSDWLPSASPGKPTPNRHGMTTDTTGCKDLRRVGEVYAAVCGAKNRWKSLDYIGQVVSTAMVFNEGFSIALFDWSQLRPDSFHSFVLRHSKMVFGGPMPVPINVFNTDGSVPQWLKAFELPLFLDYIVFLFPPKTWFPPKRHKFVITFPINSPVCWAMCPRLCAYMKAVTKFFKLPPEQIQLGSLKIG